MSNHRISLDTDAFVSDYVSGKFTIGQLAERYGISRSLVEKILNGRRRPEVAKMIRQSLSAARRRTRSRLTFVQDKAVETLCRAMDGQNNAAAVAAARDVLTRSLPDAAADEPPADDTYPDEWPDPLGPSLTQLSPELKTKVLEELGGPME